MAELQRWTERAERALTGHYESARSFEVRARWLSAAGLVSTISATVLTTLVLAASHPATALKVAAAVVSALTTITALLARELDFRVRAQAHRMAGAKYAAIRRRLELLREPTGADWHAIQELWDEASADAPIIPGREWRSAQPVPSSGR